MKTCLLSLFLCLLFVTGWICEAEATGFECGPLIQQNSRSWRLEEQTIQIDSTGTWENYSRIQNYFSQSSPAAMDSTVISYFDQILWMPASTKCYSYDASGQFVTEILTKLIFMGESWPYGRSVFTYDANNRLIKASKQMMGGLDREWIDYQTLDILYQQNGYIDKIITWGMGDPENPPDFTKTQFSLDNIGKIISQHDYSSADSLQWTLFSQSDYTYHISDATNGLNLVEAISRTYPFSFADGLPMQIGLLTEVIKSIWGPDFNINDKKETYTYTSGGPDRSLNYHNVYYWDDSCVWKDLSRNTYSYDIHGNLSTDLIQNWNEDIQTWSNYMQISNYWEQTTANEENVIAAINDISLTVYPNPCRGNFEITVQSKSKTPVRIELFNAKGQKVSQHTIIPTTNSSLSYDLVSRHGKGSGVYFIKAVQGTNQVSKKIINLN